MKNPYLMIGAFVLCTILHATAGTFHDPGTGPSVTAKGSEIFNKLKAPLAPTTYTVTNTNSSGSGSFAQAVINANGHAGSDFIVFQAPTNQTATGGRTWARITLTSSVTITDAVTIDATAAGSPLQPGNNMTAIFGAATAGTGPDGVSGTGDEAVLSGVQAPKVELVGSGTGADNIRINASGVTIRGLAFRDLGDGGADIYIAYTSGLSLTNILIEGNTFGIVPTSASDPGSGRRTADGIAIASDYGGSTNNNNSIVDGTIIRNNYFGFFDNRFVLLGAFFNPISTVRNTLVEGNYFETNGLTIPGDQSSGEGIYVGSINQNNTIRGNYLRDISADGYRESAIEVMGQSNASSNLVIENNTITDVAGVGMRIDVCQVPTVAYQVRIRQNVIFNTTESGVTINQTHVELSRNSIYNNGSGGGRIPIDLVPRHSSPSSTFSLDGGGNGVSANDGGLNFSAGNHATDYPIINAAMECSSSPTIQVNGYVGSSPNQTVFANATVEIYKASNDGNNMGEIVSGDGRSVIHPEPRTYLGTCTADANGAFNCSLAIPSYVSINSGDMLVGTATVNNSTSETGSVLVLLHDGGDAPSSYNTDISCGAINGPIHMNLNNNLRLGSTVDNDAVVVGSTVASNDDATGGDDEDGVTSFGSYTVSTHTYTVNVQVTNTSGTVAYLVGYVDYNADGDFGDAGERSVTRVVANGFSGTRTVTFNFTGSPVNRDTYARFRLTTIQAQAESFTGGAVDGEVEDYFMPMVILPIRIGLLKGVKSGNFDQLSWGTLSENQTLFFEVEQSKDGLTWQQVATVPAAGQSATGAQYGYNNLSGTTGTQHYRVVLHEANGSKKYYNTVCIGNIGSADFRIDFNPSAKEFKVLLPSNQEVYQIRLYTSTGLQMQSGVANRTSEFSMRDKQLTKGLYLVVISNNSNQPVFTQKVLIR